MAIPANQLIDITYEGVPGYVPAKEVYDAWEHDVIKKLLPEELPKYRIRVCDLESNTTSYQPVTTAVRESGICVKLYTMLSGTVLTDGNGVVVSFSDKASVKKILKNPTEVTSLYAINRKDVVQGDLVENYTYGGSTMYRFDVENCITDNNFVLPIIKPDPEFTNKDSTE